MARGGAVVRGGGCCMGVGGWGGGGGARVDDTELEVRKTSVIACSLHKKLTGVLAIFGSVSKVEIAAHALKRTGVWGEWTESHETSPILVSMSVCTDRCTRARCARSRPNAISFYIYLLSILQNRCSITKGTHDTRRTRHANPCTLWCGVES